jgi:hypothetical protein
MQRCNPRRRVPVSILAFGAVYYERMIYSRHGVSSVFHREEEERSPVQRAALCRDNFPELTARQIFEAGMFLQRDMAIIVPTSSEYEGVGNQKDFDPNADGLMVHAGCYLVINGKEGHSIHASFFGDAEKHQQHGAIVRGFKDIQGEPPARVRAARMVLELPKATTTPFIPQEAFCNIYGDMVDAEQALEVTAREYMESG